MKRTYSNETGRGAIISTRFISVITLHFLSTSLSSPFCLSYPAPCSSNIRALSSRGTGNSRFFWVHVIAVAVAVSLMHLAFTPIVSVSYLLRTSYITASIHVV